MNIVVVIIIVLVLMALIGSPGIGMWQHSYGWYPSGGLGLVVLILVILLLMGRL